MKRKPSIVRWGLFFLTAVPTSLGCSSDSQPCNPIDCDGNLLRIRFASEGTPEVFTRLLPGNYSAQIVADESSWSCGLVIDENGFDERECRLDNTGVLFSSSSVVVLGTPSKVEVLIENEGTVLADAEFAPRYSIVKVGCDTCVQAEDQLTLNDEWLNCLSDVEDDFEWVPCQNMMDDSSED